MSNDTPILRNLPHGAYASTINADDFAYEAALMSECQHDHWRFSRIIAVYTFARRKHNNCFQVVQPDISMH